MELASTSGGPRNASPGELNRIIHRRFKDGSERSYTVHWILDHVQEHEIHDRAQLNLACGWSGSSRPRSNAAQDGEMRSDAGTSASHLTRYLGTDLRIPA